MALIIVLEEVSPMSLAHCLPGPRPGLSDPLRIGPVNLGRDIVPIRTCIPRSVDAGYHRELLGCRPASSTSGG